MRCSLEIALFDSLDVCKVFHILNILLIYRNEPNLSEVRTIGIGIDI